MSAASELLCLEHGTCAICKEKHASSERNLNCNTDLGSSKAATSGLHSDILWMSAALLFKKLGIRTRQSSWSCSAGQVAHEEQGCQQISRHK